MALVRKAAWEAADPGEEAVAWVRRMPVCDRRVVRAGGVAVVLLADLLREAAVLVSWERRRLVPSVVAAGSGALQGSSGAVAASLDAVAAAVPWEAAMGRPIARTASVVPCGVRCGRGVVRPGQVCGWEGLVPAVVAARQGRLLASCGPASKGGASVL